MAKPPKAFDVWFVTANTVYKGVPYHVVADWTQQGRLGASDMVRPAGTTVAWGKVEDQEGLDDYLPKPSGARSVPAGVLAGLETVHVGEVVTEGQLEDAGEPVELPEPEPLPGKPRIEEDDEVDMIPLIDISMVLLVFFIIIRAAGALAPVDVPEMKYAGELSADPQAITINIDKADEFTVVYSVRKGQTPAREKHDKLSTPEDAIKALKDLLAETNGEPPEVRIACRKELPNDRVTELQLDLDLMFKNKQINSYVATVVEAPKK
ncbi:MAG: biopolymer transporter ExbD [Planctomycetes bacterium]|nr:biopolymer transporter ExbD [Planctomycetota bacterium]